MLVINDEQMTKWMLFFFLKKIDVKEEERTKYTIDHTNLNEN